MDDETYRPVDSSQVPGNESHNTVDDFDIEDRTKRKLKFYDKYLVCQAIAQDGQVSETINIQVYLEECVKKRLVPFISKLK